jgi:hypothetical protein
MSPGRHDYTSRQSCSVSVVAWVCMVTLFGTCTVIIRSPLSPGRQVAKYVTGAHFAAVARRISTAEILLLLIDLVRTAWKAWHFTIMKIILLTLFKEIIAIHTKNHSKHKYSDLQTVKKVEQIFTTKL